METMYIRKGSPIIIGDTITGNARTGHRFFFYTMREAEQKYRQIFGLKGRRFKKVRVGTIHFGYIN